MTSLLPLRRAGMLATVSLALGGLLLASPGLSASAAPGSDAAPPSIPGFDVSAFQNPTDQKPGVLWFWDRMQTNDEIDAKLQSIHDAGFTETTIFRWFGDIPEAYFSDAWFDRVEHLLAKSKELGLKVWLDNDDKFPSGSAGGFIINGGTVGSKTYEPRPDLGVKTLQSRGSAIRDGGGPVALHDLFGSSLQFESGQVVADSASAPGITLLRDGADWTDYTVDATFTIRSATAGFMVRSTDAQNGYLVDVRADGKVDIWRQTAGAFTNLRIGSVTRPGWSATAPHDIRIALNGSAIDVTVDGVAEPSISDGAHPAGGVGMRVDGTQSWLLDDLAIAASPGQETLYANDFADVASIADFDTQTELLDDVVAIAARPATGPDSTDPSKIVDVTSDYLSSTGTWEAPAGSWRFEAYTSAIRGGDRAAYADTMSVEAQTLSNEIIMDEYYERFGDYFGSTLLGFADDEPEVGRHGDDLPPWSPDLGSRLVAEGIPTAAAISSIYNDFGAAGDTLRSSYYRAMSDQWVDAYWKTKYTWAEEHGVSIISNPLYDEYGPAGRVHESGNLMTMHQWAQIPGTDLISDQVERGYVRNLPYEPASVAHQLGRPLVYDELMGASGWQKSVADVRQGAAMSAVRGINMALYHATFDAPETAPFPPTFSEDNVWWKFVPSLNEWTGRLMEFGRHTTAAQTAIVQMQRSAEAVQRLDESVVDTPFFDAEHSLESSQVDFDLVDEGALADDPANLAHAVVTADGRLQVGEMAYSAVVVPSAPLVSLEAMQRLLSFVEAGGQVVFAGSAPTQEVSGRDAELASTLGQIQAAGGSRVLSVATAGEAGAAAASLGRSGVQLATPSADVRVLRFQEGATSGYLLLNEGTSAVETTFSFPAAGVPATWDPDTGTVAVAPEYSLGDGTTSVPLKLEPNVPVGVTVAPEMSSTAHVTRSDGTGVVQSAVTEGDGVRVTVRSSEGGSTGVSVVTSDDASALPLAAGSASGTGAGAGAGADAGIATDSRPIYFFELNKRKAARALALTV